MLHLLTSRCSAVRNRRLLLLREVACRSSKEKAAPQAGDPSDRGGTLCLLKPGDSDTQAGFSTHCVPLVIRTESYNAWPASSQTE
ncbi:hypothetical protein NQZ68_018359 [Dissostichus eleginoides]|nr:hypothetical protein NQZ68_018359 [Dissostichus eleginoides]